MSTDTNDTADKRPKDALFEVLERVKQLEAKIDSELNPSETRLHPEPTETFGRVLTALAKADDPLSSKEVEARIGYDGGSMTRIMSHLYQSYLVNREKRDVYHYSVSDLGQQVIDSWGDQKELPNEPSKPWEDSDVTKNEYIAVKLVAEAQDAPRTTDISDRFVSETDVAENISRAPAISPYISNVYNAGYVDRTPEKPYRYWATEKGKELLESE